VPVAGLTERVRLAGATWWCAHCGLQFRDNDA